MLFEITFVFFFSTWCAERTSLAAQRGYSTQGVGVKSQIKQLAVAVQC
jgi:hypothetical protein